MFFNYSDFHATSLVFLDQNLPTENQVVSEFFEATKNFDAGSLGRMLELGLGPEINIRDEVIFCLVFALHLYPDPSRRAQHRQPLTSFKRIE
jgi:hypothetical protein